MRLEEFKYFIIIFTVAYIFLCIIIEICSNKIQCKKKKKFIEYLLSPEGFLPFAQFYGINSTCSKEVLTCIYEEIRLSKRFKISQYSNKYKVTPYQFAVIVVYLEYYKLIPKKKIYLEDDYITPVDYTDQHMMYKYGALFLSRSSYEQIQSKIGSTASRELIEIDKYFLYPGFRFINSIAYYIGGQDEKK
ncbi:MAG: hypothetical protein E7160_00065 [Firmicutes bacterium]|nr:hypothetical protein [Bacillota bacterium]